MDKSTKRREGVEIQTIAVGVDAGEEACRTPPTEKGVIITYKKVYRPPIKSTYNETEILEDLNDSME